MTPLWFRLSAVVPVLVASAGCIAHGPAGAPASGAKTPAVTVAPFRSVSGARRIGAAVESQRLREAPFAAVLATNFNSLTPENEMKWTNVEPSPGQFAFRGGDALVAFAAQHDMRVRGHTLVWHTQLAPWVSKLSGEALRAAMVAHVRGVVAHYKGRVAQWDVVNEAFADGEGGGLRGDSPFSALGPGFIEEAFRSAHEADPDAILFYNDYEIEGPGAAKTEAVYRMVQQLKAAGAPIGGVGFQMHVDPRHWPAASAIRQSFERFAALGLAVEITEMDVPVGEILGDRATKLARQSDLTHDIVAACVALPACSGVTFWGLTDRYSWLNDAHWGQLRGRQPHRPLPFDADYQPKPMAAAISAALAGN
ncbi:MAG TPA: endo-1,4-beta-xylanase [Polyangia bacterium]|jgi:endo-1,4-beta-xylanase